MQLVLDNKPASILAKTTAANEAFEYVLPEGKARVRIIKLASTSAARAGEFVRFTLRFDNVGDEAVGNVTIIDNLTTRFEYVAESQECSLAASFSTDDNEGQSSLLRWEIAEPLEPGEGGRDYSVRVPGALVLGCGSGLRDAGCGMRDAGCGLRDAGCGIDVPYPVVHTGRSFNLASLSRIPHGPANLG